ncbi:hypothetical protein [Rhodococcus artemisiae]|uniref:Sigma-70-like protein n=1 Tax=Rhodococcus artemisiae TaxID=714159 RepID=A0ABU7LL94_9NOCA|nr:hypothetical protein [Rhodococcus artemisiae]MEE2062331.1 hypothetical protein [Rhodococcus artemisiae]
MSSDYTISVVRADTDDKAWTVTVHDRPDWSFREKNFAAIDARVRDLACTHDGADPAAVTVTRTRVAVGDVDVTDRLADLDEQRRRAQKVTESVGATTLELIATLRRQAGLSTRDTGSVLGLTGGRISQLEQAQVESAKSETAE